MTTPVPRPGILSIEPYVGGKSSLPGNAKPIKLSSNESAIGPSPRAIAAYEGLSGQLHRYPDGGAVALRAALAKRFGLDAARIVCGAGSDELIALLARAYAGPGDEVLYSEYGFVMYPIAALSAGATPVKAREKDYRADVDSLLASASDKTKLCFLANPNNPTGTFLPPGELARLRAGLPAHALLVIDAAYAEYVTRNDYSSGQELVEARDNVVMTRTFSKIFALGGLRLGWAYCPVAVADVLNRTRGPFNISSAAQAAGVAALDDLAHSDASRAHNDMWLPWLAGELASLGLNVVPSVGNFVLVEFPASGPKSAAAANAFLNARGIIPRAVANYGLPNHLRITVGLEHEMRAVVAALAEFLK
ncbi:MAG TPA: histidinol-phosphate transaminase [Alphaproteobacteria bacterium]|jgi:histidinol-phosphate aminotransferase|nr:histidinol-phosphate transaminase [Alphaproteobacteria bacterium]